MTPQLRPRGVKLQFPLWRTFAEYEPSIIRSRQEGSALARQRGVYKSRKPSFSPAGGRLHMPRPASGASWLVELRTRRSA